MISETVIYPVHGGEHYKKLYGKSTDTKPTDGVPNRSWFYEMDTTNVYMFDAESQSWLLQSRN